MSPPVAEEVAEPLSLRERLLLINKNAPEIEKVLSKPNPDVAIEVNDEEGDEMVHRPRRR